jgi:hypothetical protein
MVKYLTGGNAGCWAMDEHRIAIGVDKTGLQCNLTTMMRKFGGLAAAEYPNGPIAVNEQCCVNGCCC